MVERAEITSRFPAPSATAAGVIGMSFRHLTVCQTFGYALATRSVSRVNLLKRCAASNASKAFIPPISLGITASNVEIPLALMTLRIASVTL